MIKQQFIPDNVKPKYKKRGKDIVYPMEPTYITIHETDNNDVGANAQSYADVQSKGNTRFASWHIQVDDQEAIQSLPFNEAAIHAGDSSSGTGNRKSIAIEICVNEDGDFKRAVENAAAVTKQLMEKFSIPASNVVQHYDWSGKNCPRRLRSGDKGVTWDEFLCRVRS